MAIKNSKTNIPKEQDGKTGQQMADSGRFKATSPYPTQIPKELDPYGEMAKKLRDALKKVKS
jgi:hypothetical protein